jgi:spermidine synthase
VLERVEGRSGELVLRRRRGNLEIIANGAFLISDENEASSRALLMAGLEAAGQGRLDVLIGGLGLGYALDEALGCSRVRRVTVVELEPAVVRWFATYGGARAARTVAAVLEARARIVVGDVGEALAGSPEAFDLVCMDTDNGPEWLVREANAGLYDEHGLVLTQRALRRGGAAVFWSPERYAGFERRLGRVFDEVVTAGAHDVVAGRRHDYVMYVARRVD